MFYIVYKIINKFNGKFYIGMHKTKRLNDGYMGSGNLIKKAIQKYGIENFIKEILFVFDNEQDMRNKEKELVILSEMSYNLKSGGYGGFTRDACIKGYITRSKLHDNYFSLMTFNERSLNAKITNKNRVKNGYIANTNHLNTKEVYLKRKQKFGLINHQQNEKNSQYGTMWITNNISNKKIKKNDEIPLGYRKGRVKNTINR